MDAVQNRRGARESVHPPTHPPIYRNPGTQGGQGQGWGEAVRGEVEGWRAGRGEEKKDSQENLNGAQALWRRGLPMRAIRGSGGRTTCIGTEVHFPNTPWVLPFPFLLQRQTSSGAPAGLRGNRVYSP